MSEKKSKFFTVCCDKHEPFLFINSSLIKLNMIKSDKLFSCVNRHCGKAVVTKKHLGTKIV